MQYENSLFNKTIHDGKMRIVKGIAYSLERDSNINLILVFDDLIIFKILLNNKLLCNFYKVVIGQKAS